MGVYSRILGGIEEKLYTPDPYMKIIKVYAFFYKCFTKFYPVYLLSFLLILLIGKYTSLLAGENSIYSFYVFVIFSSIMVITLLPLQFVDIFSFLIYPSHHIRPALILEYVKEHLQTKGEALTFEEKKKMSEYICWAIEDIPPILKKSKIKYSELDEDLSSRFSRLEKDIVDISKEVYFNKDSNYDKQIGRIDEISKILRERNFGELNLDPEYKVPKKEKIWQRLVDIKEFKKHTSKGLVYLIMVLFLIGVLVILKQADTELYSDLIDAVLSFL